MGLSEDIWLIQFKQIRHWIKIWSRGIIGVFGRIKRWMKMGLGTTFDRWVNGCMSPLWIG